VSEVATPAGSTGIPVETRAVRAVALARRRGAVLQLAAATLLYLAFASYLTWPLVTHLNTMVYGGPGDPFGAMATYRELVDHHHNPFLPGTISQFAAPEGQPIAWARNLAQLPAILVQYLFTAAFGQVASLGIYTLLGYTLSGVFMYMFVRRLTAVFWVALLCGWAFAFFPFAVINGLGGHEDFIQGWVLVLAVWRLIELYWAPSRRNANLAGLAVILSMWWTAYFILIGGIAYLATLLASLLLAWRARRLRSVLPTQALTAAIVVAFLVLLASLSFAQPGALGLRTNSIVEFNAYSARPFEYVLPDANSPLFGSVTAGYLASHLHGSNNVESTLYVGVSTILLAAVAGIALLRGRLEPRVRSAAFILGAVTLAALLSSAPPEGTVFGLAIPFPSHFIMKVTTTWRAYSRFVILVMLGLVALAGIGLHTLLRDCPHRWRLLVMFVALVLLPLDLWSRMDQTSNVTVPSVYRVLAREPRALTAEYPLVNAGGNLYLDLFYQNIYNMPMINGYLSGTVEERRALSLANLSDPSTGPRLAALGVRYVIREAAPNPFGHPPAGTPGRGFRRVYSDAYGTLYVVTARPTGPALATLGAGFGADEPLPHGGTASWLEQPSGSITLAGACQRCDGVLRFSLVSFGSPRFVTVRLGRHVLATRWVSGITHFVFPGEYGRASTITITTTPGPQSIQKTIHVPDSRSVSVQIADLSFSWPVGHDRRR
jgi:hypothetical protein